MIPETDHKRLHKNRIVLLITPNIPEVLGTIPAQRWGASAAPNASWVGLIRKSAFAVQWCLSTRCEAGYMVARGASLGNLAPQSLPEPRLACASIMASPPLLVAAPLSVPAAALHSCSSAPAARARSPA